MQILRRKGGRQFRYPVRIRGLTLIIEFAGPWFNDDFKTEFFSRWLSGQVCPPHRRSVVFIQAAFGQPERHQAGLFPVFSVKRVGNIIRLTVTNQIQQYDE